MSKRNREMERNGQRPGGNGKENPRGSYATGPWPGFASLVRGSSRRFMTMKAGSGSILEYQTDHPSIQLPGPLSDPLRLLIRPRDPPEESAPANLTGRSISGACPGNGRGRVASAAGWAARRRRRSRCFRIVEEPQRSGRARAAATRRAHGGCGRIRRCSSGPMPPHRTPPRALSSPRKPHVRDPSPYPDGLLGDWCFSFRERAWASSVRS